MKREMEPVVDVRQLGRRVRAGRITAGFDRVADFGEAMERETGFSASDRRIYNLETGKHLPDVVFLRAICHMLGTTLDGLVEPVVREDLRHEKP